MRILQLCLGALVILGVIGSKPYVDEDGKKRWRPSRIILTSLFVSFFVSSFYSEVLLIGMMIMGTGLLLLFLSIVHMYQCYKCGKKVEATVTKVEPYGKNSTGSIMLRYIYGGITYHQGCIVERKEKHGNAYEKGKQYTIYMNPNSPTDIRDNRKISARCILLFVIGLTFCGGGISVFFPFLL